MGASRARIWICSATAAFLGTAAFFLVRQLMFIILPNHIWGGVKTAYSKDWQLEAAQGVLMCSEPDTSWVTGAALPGAIFGAQLEAFPRGLSWKRLGKSSTNIPSLVSAAALRKGECSSPQGWTTIANRTASTLPHSISIVKSCLGHLFVVTVTVLW